jgi:hypothetical protein
MNFESVQFTSLYDQISLQILKAIGTYFRVLIRGLQYINRYHNQWKKPEIKNLVVLLFNYLFSGSLIIFLVKASSLIGFASLGWVQPDLRCQVRPKKASKINPVIYNSKKKKSKSHHKSTKYFCTHQKSFMKEGTKTHKGGIPIQIKSKCTGSRICGRGYLMAVVC